MSATCAAITGRAENGEEVTYICLRIETRRGAGVTDHGQKEVECGDGTTCWPGRGGSGGARWVLQPLPVSITGNAEDLKSCETSSGVSQLNRLAGLLQEGPPPSAIHRSMTDGPEKKGWLRLGWCCIPLNPPGALPAPQQRGRAVVKLQTSSSRGVSSVFILGLNTATADFCRNMSSYKSGLLVWIGPRWTPALFSVGVSTHLPRLCPPQVAKYFRGGNYSINGVFVWRTQV